jgi:hypothetical protein
VAVQNSTRRQAGAVCRAGPARPEVWVVASEMSCSPTVPNKVQSLYILPYVGSETFMTEVVLLPVVVLL